MSGETAARPAPSQARIALRTIGRAIAASVRSTVMRAAGASQDVAQFASPVVSVVSTTGWLVLAAAVASLLLAWLFGWIEFAFLGFTLLAALLIAVSFVFGRMSYRVGIELKPARVVAGERALGRMLVTNTGTRASTPARLELPVGAGLAEFMVPALAPEAEHEELFAVPTNRRAVIVAGPAESVRGDQLGLLRRTVRWTDPVELFVHPVTARLQPSAAGLMRDLEGEITKTITNNDISFHALRAYAPGDALRNVHWRTSARTGQLMVRQYEETRRSQLTLVQTTERKHYASDEEFELGVSVLASIAVQVIRDGTRLSVVTEGLALRTATPTTLLDDSSRIEQTGGAFASVRDFVREATKRLPPPSVVIAVAGSGMPVAEFRSIETIFSADTTMVAMRVELGAASRISRISGAVIVTIGDLADLSRIMRRVRP
ncbi:DUF58 domain-containing protein [Agromyces sp. ISL-38]|uniref:DUF58 domain-containing protein n=1 Tax=Agromyces sp. ISL-38 TaxID=2819107 RepID=UPI001BE808F6|nr:DUF58 domain-containing protein [Agromyces sp. ISL-38]MBT2499661.1 DUF58 domain-containing protein [Agromyces sp. ISL-38]MBT2516192.1 DUF58 domain-containing protein [Streptomyces sp. ISL-90]